MIVGKGDYLCQTTLACFAMSSFRVCMDFLLRSATLFIC